MQQQAQFFRQAHNRSVRNALVENHQKAWTILWKCDECQSYWGIQELMNFESTLELTDREGKTASFKK